MDPKTGQRFSGEYCRNSVYILMMGEKQLPAAGIDIVIFAQIFHRHCGTLNMPGRAYISPLGFEKYPPLQFRQPGSFKEREIPGIFFFILVQIYGGAQFYFVNIDTG